jgi:hypothetical protein
MSLLGYLGKRTFDCISMLNIFIELGGSDLNIRISLRLFRLDSIVFSTPDVGSNVRHIFLRFDLEYSWRRYNGYKLEYIS